MTYTNTDDFGSEEKIPEAMSMDYQTKIPRNAMALMQSRSYDNDLDLHLDFQTLSSNPSASSQVYLLTYYYADDYVICFILTFHRSQSRMLG